MGADFGNQWSGAYYGGQVYDGYGYALPPPHDPTMYAAAYGAYPVYGNHQQQVSWDWAVEETYFVLVIRYYHIRVAYQLYFSVVGLVV